MTIDQQSKTTPTDTAALQKESYARWQKEQDADRDRDRDKPRIRQAPVVVTVSNVSRSTRVFRDCFGTTITLGPSESKEVPMAPGAVEFYNKLNDPSRPVALHSALRIVKDASPGAVEARAFVAAEVEKDKVAEEKTAREVRERVKPKDEDKSKAKV